MRVRVVIELDVPGSIPYIAAKRWIKDMIDSWSASFQPVFLSIEKVKE